MSSTSANAGGAAAPSASSSLPRLGPAWHRGPQGGRGFQPPPAVPDGRGAGGAGGAAGAAGGGGGGGVYGRDRSGSGSADKKNHSSNSFSALLDEDEGGSNGGKHDEGGARRSSSRGRFGNLSVGTGGGSSASSGASYGRSSSIGTGAERSGPGGIKTTGRSLADLAARVPASPMGRSHASYRSTSSDDGGGSGRISSGFPRGESGKVIRFTREKLMSLRPVPKPDAEAPPFHLKQFEGAPILSKVPQDPVCWDAQFDAEEIWAQAARERPRGSIGALGKPGGGTAGSTSLRALSEGSARMRGEIDGLGDDRGRQFGTGGGRWERGVALPPADQHLSRGRGMGRGGDAENPEDLWDDPLSGTNAAADFSQYGAMPGDDRGNRSRGGSVGSGGSVGGGFDLNEMSEAARRFEEELHGTKRRMSDAEDTATSVNSFIVQPVDPHKPLAIVGTTIRSGSGDDVNVFEDFGVPTAIEQVPPKALDSSEIGIKGGEEMSVSSRLMQVIGVTPDNTGDNDDGAGSAVSMLGTGWAASAPGSEVGEPLQDPFLSQSDSTDKSAIGMTIGGPSGSSVPSNPWGDTIIPGAVSQTQVEGMDLSARLEAAVTEQRAREARAAAEAEQQRQREEAEIMRRRQEEEESAKRQAAIQAQQQAEAQARQQQAAMQAQQQAPGSGHSQVELVLMERICAVLENSWGRNDLGSILSTLHAEDSRVIPLLGSVDALRALIARHPHRVALSKDPVYGADVASLLVTNAVWQQQKRAQAQQEEIQRQRQEQQRQQEQQMQAAQQAAAARAQAEAEERERATASERKSQSNEQFTITNAPWYYADPQGNIQVCRFCRKCNAITFYVNF
uniref:GYF domain-containing protein n=2 Tax=Ditylum brightwellii TaxID=49249 RepID=A0A7S4QU95_9STRA|mmetsp:Transcript_24361/g.36333  ORF Transcript_24361/g.36333 Transcript_24361/m.36333 type:complete len:848 (-) Transcript_24361:34-2577(-)